MVFITAYLNMGLSRYISAPMGTLIDATLALTWILMLIRGSLGMVPWKRANTLMTWLAVLWFLYLLLELFNPLVPGKQSWIFSARGFGMYFLMAAPLTMVVFDRQKDWEKLIVIWGILTLFALAKALGQKYIGFDPYETKWLNEGGALTHIIGSGIRYFSFFTDAGQFGATMGHSSIVFLILGLNNKIGLRKIFYFLVAGAAFWAMLMSGTRGAIAVPAVGLMCYIVLCKNIRLFLVGSVLLVSAFVFFKYTYIGQGNYEIRRMRSAFSPTQDASLSVRLENQKKFAAYLEDKPFGGGLGTASGNGNRFYPGTFLASVPTDSWYVLLWAETGIIGLSIYLAMMFLILAFGSIQSFFKIKHKRINGVLMAFIAGGSGILVASYGNAVIGQFPSSIIFPITMAYLFVAPALDKKESSEELAETEKS